MCHQPGKKSASSSSMPFPCGIRIVTNLVGPKKIYCYYIYTLYYISIISFIMMIRLVVSTPLKNISHWEGLSHTLWKIKNVWNHQPVLIWCDYEPVSQIRWGLNLFAHPTSPPRSRLGIARLRRGFRPAASASHLTLALPTHSQEQTAGKCLQCNTFYFILDYLYYLEWVLLPHSPLQSTWILVRNEKDLANKLPTANGCKKSAAAPHPHQIDLAFHGCFHLPIPPEDPHPSAHIQDATTLLSTKI